MRATCLLLNTSKKERKTNARLRSNFVFMHPDYPHKLFNDRRNHFNLLMETLAMDSAES
jgi:hypothetical protein